MVKPPSWKNVFAKLDHLLEAFQYCSTMSQGICTSINWFMWERERGKFLSVGKQHAISIKYHHQHDADMCSAILTCTSFSDNILPGLKGQPHCVATKRVFNIANPHGVMSWKILSTHHSWGKKNLLTSHLPRKHGSMESGSHFHHEI